MGSDCEILLWVICVANGDSNGTSLRVTFPPRNLQRITTIRTSKVGEFHVGIIIVSRSNIMVDCCFDSSLYVAGFIGPEGKDLGRPGPEGNFDHLGEKKKNEMRIML